MPDKKRAAAPAVSIVIVNWNGRRFLEGCLGSIFRQTGPSFEVVFVDNGSTDGSVDFVRKSFPQVLVIENTDNKGFARANNQGIEAAKGAYVLTLNNDTELDDGFLQALATAADSAAPDVGMWAPKILSMTVPGEIDSVGGLLIYPDGLAKGRGRLEVDNGQYDRTEEVFIPSACAGVYRKAMLDEVGLFDEDFFAYCEDTDLGLRARMAGWKTMSLPGAVVRHYYSGTGGRYTPFKAYLVERNHLWVAVKNLPLKYLLLFPFYTVWRYLVQVYGIITGRGAGGRFVEDFSPFRLFTVLVRAYGGAIRRLPSVLSQRGEIMRRRRAAGAEISRWFRLWRISAAHLVLKD